MLFFLSLSEEKVNEAVDAVCKEFKLVTEMSKSKRYGLAIVYKIS